MASLIQKHAHVKGQRSNHHIFKFQPNPSWAKKTAKPLHVLSITKSISKNFKPNFVCLLTNERYKTYQTGFFFGHLGHAPGVGLGGTVGVVGSKKIISKFNPIWCVSYLHEWHMQGHHFWVPAPGALGRGKKVKYH